MPTTYPEIHKVARYQFVKPSYAHEHLLKQNLLWGGHITESVHALWEVQRRSVVGYSPWGLKESDMTERLHFLSFFNFFSPDVSCWPPDAKS